MDLETTALPGADTSAEAGGQDTALPESQTEGQQQDEGSAPEGQPPKKEKTPEEREIARLRRRVDNLTRKRYELESRVTRTDVASTRQGIESQTADQPAEDEPVQLSRRELQELIDKRAQELAPTITQAKAEIERRRETIEKLATTWGQEKFDALAADLDDAFGGLADQHGKPKAATDAIFEADNPQALIEFLADPENAAEAQSIARMSPIQAGRAIARLETKLSAKASEDKPKPSNAPRPLESERARGSLNTAPDPSDTKAWMKWANEQERGKR